MSATLAARRLGAAFFFFTIMALSAAATAAPDVACEAATASDPFLGEGFEISVSIDNTGSTTGFAPAAEVLVPPGITLGAASF